jgi:hypothetical protein
VEGKTGKEMEDDRMFLRQFTSKSYLKIFIRSMIPPEFYFWEFNQKYGKKKVYFMVNMVFKGI